MSFSIRKVFSACEDCPIVQCQSLTTCTTTTVVGPQSGVGGIGAAYPPYQTCGNICVGPVMISLPNQQQTGCPMGQSVSYNPANPEGVGFPNPTLPCLVSNTNGTAITISPKRFINPNGDPGAEDVKRYYSQYTGLYPADSYASLPNGDTQLHMGKMSLDYQSYSVKDRLMMISGYNRYNYIGPLATSCTASHRWGQNPNVGYFDSSQYAYDMVGLSAFADHTSSYLGNWWSPEGPNPDATKLYGIIGIEKSLRDRYPLADSSMDFPLFGEIPATAPNDGGFINENECCGALPLLLNPPCVVGCFGDCPANHTGDGAYSNGIGHYFGTVNSAPSSATYRYSAACFNPDSIFGWRNEGMQNRIQVPHCSLYSLIWAVRNWVLNQCIYYAVEPDAIWQGWGPNGIDGVSGLSAAGQTGNPFWYSHDPGVGGYSGADKLNAVTILSRLQEKLPVAEGDMPGMFWKIPKVYFWDKDSYLASPNWQKWQHVYIAGSLNILLDTGCVGTNGVKTTTFTIDDTCIKAGDNFYNQPKFYGFMGCQAQSGSVHTFELNWLQCDSALSNQFKGHTGGCGALIDDMGTIA